MTDDRNHEAQAPDTVMIKASPDTDAICKLCGARFDERVQGVCPAKFLTTKPEPRNQKATQLGPPVMVGGYRIRVISDSEHPEWLAKGTRQDSTLQGSNFVYEGGPPSVQDLLVTEDGVSVFDKDGREQRIPAAALEALLKIGGWKVERPQ